MRRSPLALAVAALAPLAQSGSTPRVPQTAADVARPYKIPQTNPFATANKERLMQDLAAHSQSGGQFFGIHASNNGKIMIFAGGIPSRRDGKVVGAIGVSGGSGDQDHPVTEAGAQAF